MVCDYHPTEPEAHDGCGGAGAFCMNPATDHGRRNIADHERQKQITAEWKRQSTQASKPDAIAPMPETPEPPSFVLLHALRRVARRGPRPAARPSSVSPELADALERDPRSAEAIATASRAGQAIDLHLLPGLMYRDLWLRTLAAATGGTWLALGTTPPAPAWRRADETLGPHTHTLLLDLPAPPHAPLTLPLSESAALAVTAAWRAAVAQRACGPSTAAELENLRRQRADMLTVLAHAFDHRTRIAARATRRRPASAAALERRLGAYGVHLRHLLIHLDAMFAPLPPLDARLLAAAFTHQTKDE